MKTEIALDDALVKEALDLTGAKTEKELVDLALRELIKKRRKKDLTELAGRIQLHEGFDHKALRKTRFVSD